MKKIIYISGWLGAGRDSATFRWLEQHFAPEQLECLAPGGDPDITEPRQQLAQLLEENPDALVLANSYGCFLASFFPQAQAIWINPSLYPSLTLPKISDLNGGQTDWLRHQEDERNALYANGVRANAHPVLSDSDELIPDHHTADFTDFEPVIVEAGIHKLTNAQRTACVLPLITSLWH